MTDIKNFDGETIHVTNQIYDKQSKKFIFKTTFNNLNLYVEDFDINNTKYDSIIGLSNNNIYNEPTIVIHTLHACWSHAYIDFMFSFFWTYSNLKEKYNINEVNFFIRKGKMLMYKHNQDAVINNKYKKNFQTLIELIPHNNLIFEHLLHGDTTLLFKNCYHYILDDRFQRSPYNCRNYYFNRHTHIENVKYNDKTISEYLTKFSEHIFKKYNLNQKENSNKQKNIVILNKKPHPDNTMAIITIPNLEYIVDIINNNKNYTYNGIKYFEDLDFKTQLEIIIDNDIIISVHGGALLHMIHGRNKLYIEYFNDSRTNSMYQRVSSLTNNRLLQLPVNSNKSYIYNILNKLNY